MTLDDILRDGFAAFTRQHAVTLDAWEARAKRDIAAMGESHRRGIAQKTRAIRVQLIAARPEPPNPGDPDYQRVLQARARRRDRLMLDAEDTLLAYESRLRLVLDQPYFTLKGQA